MELRKKLRAESTQEGCVLLNTRQAKSIAGKLETCYVRVPRVVQPVGGRVGPRREAVGHQKGRQDTDDRDNSWNRALQSQPWPPKRGSHECAIIGYARAVAG